MAIYTVSISSAGSSDVVSVADGSTYATLEVSAGRGPKGDGWTGVSYDSNTGRFTFTSNDGLGYVSDDITVDLDAAVAAAQAAQSGAEGAEAATEALFDQFGDQYLGPKASDPTVDNDGDPLTAGDIYFNTTDSVLKFYSGSDWVAPESIATTAASDAQAAQAAAETAETNAETAQTAAETAQTGAETAETNAAASETAAASSAAAASTSADEAAASAASIDTDNIDINGGTIDGTVIGGTTPAAGSFTTGSFTGDLSFAGNTSYGDNDKAIFGAGSDLQIYHSGSHSYITDTGTGSLYIRGSDFVSIQAADGTNSIVADTDSEVTLYHNGSPKLATTSTGIDVTGTITSDGLTVSGSGPATISSSNDSPLRVNSTDTSSKISVGDSSGSIGLTNYAGRLDISVDGDAGSTANQRQTARFHSNGDISFYEDTGTTAKFFWDASAERLGIGTSSPSEKLHVAGDIKIATGANAGVLHFGETSDAAKIVSLGASAASQTLGFHTNSTERLRIDSSGNLLVGTTDPLPADNAVEGFVYRNGLSMQVHRDAGPALGLGRGTSDGSILNFLKDGTAVGSISVSDGDRLNINSGSMGFKLFDDNKVILPTNGSGTNADAQVTLGG